MSACFMPTRRRLLQSTGALAAALTFSAPSLFAAENAGNAASATQPDNADITGRLARYMVSARDTTLPDAVVLECKHRILDTFGAMVSARA